MRLCECRETRVWHCRCSRPAVGVKDYADQIVGPVETMADHGRCVARKYLFGVGREIDAAFLQCDETFDRIEGYFHIKRTYIIR